MAQSCDQRQAIEAKIWNGKSTEAGIIRDVNCSDGKPGCEEYLPASHPSFDMFRCMTVDDTNKLIELALKRCGK